MARINQYNNIPRRRNRRLVSNGDLNQRIKLQRRVLLTQFQTGGMDTLGFNTFANPWSMIETTRGIRSFNGVDLDAVYTHTMFIRYRKDLDQTIWVEYKAQRYDVLHMENLDERSEFICLYCKLSGTNETDNQASRA